MENLTCVIVEDEKPAARRLARMLSEESLHCIAQLHDVSSSIAWFKENPSPSIVFLDIQLSDGLSFEIFEKVNIKCPIIFTTAYDEYALRAFKLNSIDYLLKPIDRFELKEAVNKYKEQSKNDQGTLFELQQFMQQQLALSHYKKRFSVQIGQQIKTFAVEDVALFYSEDKATHALLFQGRSYVLDFSLDELENQLEPSLFFRINRKFIVHHQAIENIYMYSNSRLKLEIKPNFQEMMIVSRERVKSFKTWLG